MKELVNKMALQVMCSPTQLPLPQLTEVAQMRSTLPRKDWQGQGHCGTHSPRGFKYLLLLTGTTDCIIVPTLKERKGWRSHEKPVGETTLKFGLPWTIYSDNVSAFVPKVFV